MTDGDLPEPGETRNELHGDVSGNAFQARDVHGDVYQGRDFYFVDRPAPPAPRRHPARVLLPFLPHVIAAVVLGSLAAGVLIHHESGGARLLAALAVLALLGLIAVAGQRWRLIERCTPAVLREARTKALAALAAVAVVAAIGAPLQPAQSGTADERFPIVAGVLAGDVAMLCVWQVVLRRRKR
ncbi:MAG TPA: hypothetical protein VL652_13005 [Kutzneria sp.]|nr:hypothetical protein [Kutzneria sp.]